MQNFNRQLEFIIELMIRKRNRRDEEMFAKQNNKGRGNTLE